MASQFMFSVLCLGEPRNCIDYLQNGSVEHIAQDPQTSQWQMSFKFKESTCNIDIIVPVTINAKFDELIVKADGILYFLNPNSPEDVDLFKNLVQIIQTVQRVQRDIPTVIVFRDPSNLIQLPSNQLLEWIWTTYPFEAFVSDFASPNQIHEIMQELSECMMTGQPLINYDTAWLQIPLLIGKANEAITQKNWLVAARLTERIAKIATRFHIMDQFIYAEQASVLYANAKKFMDAAVVIKDFNPLAEKFKEKYVEELLIEGQQLSDQKIFDKAAKLFEKAGHWANTELLNQDLKVKSIKLAINSWIEAFEIQFAFPLLDVLDHTLAKAILEEITNKIILAADALSSTGKDEMAKTFLYLCFDRYQKVGLFESIKIFSAKVSRILLRIFDRQLKYNERAHAKMTLDELYNIWESYSVKQENIDIYLIKLIRLFFQDRDFSKADVLITKLQSLELQKQLTEERVQEEEKIKQRLKQVGIDDLNRSLSGLMKYINEENMLLDEMNKSVFQNAEKIRANEDPVNAIVYLKHHADWLLNSLGHEQLSYRVIEYLFDIYLKEDLIERFLHEIYALPDEIRKIYLQHNISNIDASFTRLIHKTNLDNFEALTLALIKLLRSHLLYEESRIFIDLLITYLIETGSAVEVAENKEKVDFCIKICLKVDQYNSSFQEGVIVNLDPIYTKIIEFYLHTNDFLMARKYNERLMDREKAKEFYGRMEQIEVATSLQKVKNQRDLHIDADILKNIARDQQLTRENVLRMRIALKNRYYQSGLDLITKKNLPVAAKNYIDSAIELIKVKKYELAGISIGICQMIYFLLNEIPNMKSSLSILETEASKLGLSSTVFHELFPVRLVDYILQMHESSSHLKNEEIIKLFNSIALFPEEQIIIDTLLGKVSDVNIKPEKAEEEKEMATNYKMLLGKMIYDPMLYPKRLLLEGKFWAKCHDEFANSRYDAASQCYLNTIDELQNRNLEAFTKISVIMGMLSLLKVKSAQEVRAEFERFLFKRSSLKTFVQAVEFKILEYLLKFIESPEKAQEVAEISQTLQNKLPLFDWEKSFLVNLIHKTSIAESKNQTSSTISLNSTTAGEEETLLSQQMVVLSQQFTELHEIFADLRKKRISTQETYYADIIQDLQNNRFLNAADKYVNLSKRMARRNDYELAGIMIYLATLCQVRAKKQYSEIKNSIDEFLSALGLVKKIFEDTFGVKITLFFLDAMKAEDPSIKVYLQSIIKRLPLFDWEELLFEDLKLTF